MKKLLPVLSILWSAQLSGQTSATTTASTMTFDELRAAYATALKKEHLPVLQEYLADLQKRKASVTTAEQVAVDAEIARVQSLLAGAGIFEPLQKTLPVARTNGPGKQVSGVLLTLEPKEVLPGPEVITAPEAKVMLGRGSWPCKRIPAGTYDLVARYETHMVPPDAMLRIQIGEQSFEKKVSQANITGPGKARVIRLVQFTLSEDLVDSQISIHTTPGSPWFGLRTAFVAHPPPPKK
jgi:hypothetical protein